MCRHSDSAMTNARSARSSRALARAPPAPPTLAQWCAAGPFTLALSCSFFGYFAHAGVLDALLCASRSRPRA